MMKISRASCSMPYLCRMVRLDEVPYLDGGIGDSLPVRHAMNLGYEKNVVILTRAPGYRKEGFSSPVIGLGKTRYYKYPRLVEQMESEADAASDVIDSLDTSGIIEKPEQGAVFEVYLKSAGSYEDAKETERDLITTDENGYAKTKDLPYGVYVVHQVEGEEGKAFVKDFSVYIDTDGKTYYYILNNTTINAYIRVEKRDAETGNLVAASGIGFRIYDASGNLVTQQITYPTPTVLDTFYTNDEG